MQWRPLVDDLLRKKVGYDFDIANAKQKYIESLLDVRKVYKKDAETHRRHLRHEIVEIAKQLWAFGVGDSEIDKCIRLAREAFAPVSMLPEFLFPARCLDPSKLTLPFDVSEKWLEDPTCKLKSSREIVTRSSTWKQKEALRMVTELCSWSMPGYRSAGRGGTVTTWVKVSDEYHLRRIEKTMTADFAIEFLGKSSPYSPYTSLPKNFHRLRVVLTKLHIIPYDSTLPRLEEHELALAKKIYFKKLLMNCCVGCPGSGLLAFPRGFEVSVGGLLPLHVC